MAKRRKISSEGLRSCDFLGRDFRLTFNGKEKFSSKFSRVMSISIIIVVCVGLMPFKLYEFLSEKIYGIKRFDKIAEVD